MVVIALGRVRDAALVPVLDVASWFPSQLEASWSDNGRPKQNCSCKLLRFTSDAASGDQNDTCGSRERNIWGLTYLDAFDAIRANLSVYRKSASKVINCTRLHALRTLLSLSNPR